MKVTRSETETLVPVIVGTFANAYGLLRSLSERGLRSVVAAGDRGPTTWSRHVLQRWPLPSTRPTAQAVDALLDAAQSTGQRYLLLLTDEAWMAAIIAQRDRLASCFELPFGDSETITTIMTKPAMHAWCTQHGFRVPCTASFLPGEDWPAFLLSAQEHLPVILKPAIKGVGDESIGFMYREFTAWQELEDWGRSQGEVGPDCAMLYQKIVPGPTENLLSAQGYRSSTGRTYMAGYTKLRQNPPVHGCSTAARLSVDQEVFDITERMLDKLAFWGFFDVEFKRDETSRELFFLELNPRPGMLNYGATLAGVNLPWLAHADASGIELPPAISVNTADRIWVLLVTDLVAHVIYYRLRGQGQSLGSWLASLRGRKRVYAFLDGRDLAVFVNSTVRDIGQYLKHLSAMLRRVFRRG